jgi:hypothetical protein
MKKILTLLFISGILGFLACGPSATEKAEKLKNDSIRKTDSLAEVVNKNKNKFVGKWRVYNGKYSQPSKIEISRNGDSFILIDMFKSKNNFTYQDGILKGDFLNVTYGADNDHIFYNFDEWERY